MKGEPYFPFLNHLSLPEGDPEKTIQPKIYGYTYCCQNCFNVLFKQYLIYEKERFPQGMAKKSFWITVLFLRFWNGSTKRRIISKPSKLSESIRIRFSNWEVFTVQEKIVLQTKSCRKAQWMIPRKWLSVIYVQEFWKRNSKFSLIQVSFRLRFMLYLRKRILRRWRRSTILPSNSKYHSGNKNSTTEFSC